MNFNTELNPELTSVWDTHCPIVKSTDGRHVEVFLTDHIATPDMYNELVFELQQAKLGDEWTFYINNGGGAVDSAFYIINAIKHSKAHTTAKLSGTIASAATIIALHCDDLEVSPFISFLAHNYYHGAQGTGNQVKDYVDFTDRELKRAFRIIYKNFLTDEEIKLVTERDKEVWLNELEVAERWAKYKAARDEV